MKQAMGLLVFLFLTSVLFPENVDAQSRSRSRGKTISVTHSLNIWQKRTPYNWANEFTSQNDTLFLRFLTSNSGTFLIKEGEPFDVVYTRENVAPSIGLALAASVRILNNDNFLFHEFAITRLSIGSNEDVINYTIKKGETNHIVPFGFKQRFAQIAVRYSFGKYFVKRRKSKVRFGISGGVEPSVYALKVTPRNFNDYPLKGTIYSIEMSLQPQLSFALSKYVNLDFNLMSNFLVADFGKINENNPRMTLQQQEGEREYKVPDVVMGFGVALKYVVKDTGRRR
ncbi:MAG: hypothetical protein CMJ42_15210 [Phyllobacteriaceae bacterium]|nr:hypothetical protein [Phyllobacteriaceae bacterium]